MSEDAEKTFDEFMEKGYSDGLPIIPPTRARVDRMLEFTDRKPDDSLGEVPPSEYEATVESVATNAVMAGCKPMYLPVVVMEIETLLSMPNLRGAIATTGCVWPFAVVNGPIAKEIGLYSSWGVLGTGPFHRANLTIGRTMTFVIQNVGKSVPGISEKKPMWNLGRFGLCIAEAEARMEPWEPLNVEHGFKKDTSTVTVFDEVNLGRYEIRAGRGSGIFELDMRRKVKRLIEVQTGFEQPSGFPVGNPSLLIMGPERVKRYAAQGWSKQDLKEFLYENCRSNPQEFYKDYPEEMQKDLMKTVFASAPEWMRYSTSLPLFPPPENQWIVVSGARADEIWCVPTHHLDHHAFIKPITLADGTPAKSVYDFKRK